jgi:c-di-GMP phosphodiesterase
MKLQRPVFAFAALVLASTAAFGVVGHFAATSFIQYQQAHQLDDLTEVVLRRAEFAVDFAARAWGNSGGATLLIAGPRRCRRSGSTFINVRQSRMCASLTLMAR